MKKKISDKSVQKKEFSLSSKYGSNSPTNNSNNDKMTYKNQQLLKNLLKEYGLVQYLRVK